MIQYSDFSILLENYGIAPAKTMLLRHTEDGANAYRRGKDWFGSYVSIQSRPNSPFKRSPTFVCHFIPDVPLQNGSSTARFVGLTKFIDRWPWRHDQLPRLWLDEDFKDPDHDNEAADQEWSSILQEFEDLTVVDWGLSPRAWHQWGHNRKPILSGAELASVALTLYEERVWTEHRTLEANRSFSTAVKAKKYLKCEGCNMDAEGRYGREIALTCIEAHHLTPLARLQPGEKRPVNIHHDFALLCATCHRIIHRLSDPSDLIALRTLVRQ